MFSNNYIIFVILGTVICLIGGLYIAFAVTKPSKQTKDSHQKPQLDEPLITARAGYLEKLQEIVRPVVTRYLVYCQEKRDVDGFVDFSLTMFEQETGSMYDDWEKETQLCNSDYMLRLIFEKYQSRVELLCAEQIEYLEIIAAFPSRQEKVYQ